MPNISQRKTQLYMKFNIKRDIFLFLGCIYNNQHIDCLLADIFSGVSNGTINQIDSIMIQNSH